MRVNCEPVRGHVYTVNTLEKDLLPLEETKVTPDAPGSVSKCVVQL